MKTDYFCPNGCKLPKRRKILRRIKGNAWGYDYPNFSYCPSCGALMPNSLERIKDFFELYHLHPQLKRAERLIYKSEFNAAAREAFVIVETTLREKSGLDLHGVDLATKALQVDKDKKTGEIIKRPLISINKLETDSEVNEQNGLKFIVMGFLQGPRNIFQHNNVGSGGSDAITFVMMASYILNVLDGHSITKNGEWIHKKISISEIYNNTPKAKDRIRLLLSTKRRKQKTSKNESKICKKEE